MAIRLPPGARSTSGRASRASHERGRTARGVALSIASWCWLGRRESRDSSSNGRDAEERGERPPLGLLGGLAQTSGVSRVQNVSPLRRFQPRGGWTARLPRRLQPPPHLLTTASRTGWGGRCVSHRHPERAGSGGDRPPGGLATGPSWRFSDEFASPERPSWPRRVPAGPEVSRLTLTSSGRRR